jgi:hypothetical protein
MAVRKLAEMTSPLCGREREEGKLAFAGAIDQTSENHSRITRIKRSVFFITFPLPISSAFTER